MSAAPIGLADFIHQSNYAGLPDEVRHQMRRCLLDLVGVAAAGTATPLSRILRDHAHHHTPGGADAPRLLFDGRRVSAAHAALANAGTVDSMDGHDGHRLAKGHAGAAVLPAALAFLDGPETSVGPDARSTHDLVAAVAVGYEVALRAAIALHRTAEDYHSSGAWNSIGAAAVGARLLGLDTTATAHALGIAEYSAPRGPMMRGIDHPTMVKDSSAWGAQTGVTAALLAAERFTGSPAELLAGPEFEDLGTRWLSLEQYFKPHPVCRWSHPAIQAVLTLSADTAITLEEVELIEITTFEAATRLGIRRPQTTEEAQYSLPYAVAAALVHHELTPHTVLNPLKETDTQALADRVRVVESEAMTSQFPASRLADVRLELRDGRHLRSGPVTADGDPESPLDDDRLLAKFRQYTAPLEPNRTEQIANTLMDTASTSIGHLLPLLTDPPDRRAGGPPGLTAQSVTDW